MAVAVPTGGAQVQFDVATQQLAGRRGNDRVAKVGPVTAAPAAAIDDLQWADRAGEPRLTPTLGLPGGPQIALVPERRRSRHGPTLTVGYGAAAPWPAARTKCSSA